jgi:hypothetical protein
LEDYGMAGLLGHLEIEGLISVDPGLIFREAGTGVGFFKSCSQGISNGVGK